MINAKKNEETEKNKMPIGVQLFDLGINKECSYVVCNSQQFYPTGLVDGKLAMKGKFELEFKIPNKEYKFELANKANQRIASIIQEEKLLNQLQAALLNSEKALTTASDVREEKLEWSDLGTIVLEQKRIKEEIEKHKTKLNELNSSDKINYDPSRLEDHIVEEKIYLHTGRNTINSKHYNLNVTWTPQVDIEVEDRIKI
jgi:hypothetical protein